MDTAAIIAKIVGIVLFLFTARSTYKHVKGKLAKNAGDVRNQASKPGHKQEQSKVEHTLNTLLLYAWFIFMTAFSLGMVFNN